MLDFFRFSFQIDELLFVVVSFFCQLLNLTFGDGKFFTMDCFLGVQLMFKYGNFIVQIALGFLGLFVKVG